jgi:hypothetical protein
MTLKNIDPKRMGWSTQCITKLVDSSGFNGAFCWAKSMGFILWADEDWMTVFVFWASAPLTKKMKIN